MRLMSHILLGLALLLPSVVYYCLSDGSSFALSLLLCGCILFIANVFVSLICTPRSLPRLTLVQLLRRSLEKANTSARQMGNALTQATDFANCLESRETLCSDLDGSMQSKETIKVESKKLGETQLKTGPNTSMNTQSETEEQANESSVGLGPIESKMEKKSSATSASSNGHKLILAYCVWSLLYLFPVAVLLEIKDTTQRTETEVDKVVAGI